MMGVGEPVREGGGGLDFSPVERGWCWDSRVHTIFGIWRRHKTNAAFTPAFGFEDLSEDEVQVSAGELKSL